MQKKFNKTFLEWYKTKVNHPTEEVLKLETERAFPYKVAKKLNLLSTNNSKAGSSMDRIARTSITDLILNGGDFTTTPSSYSTAISGSTFINNYFYAYINSYRLGYELFDKG